MVINATNHFKLLKEELGVEPHYVCHNAEGEYCPWDNSKVFRGCYGCELLEEVYTPLTEKEQLDLIRLIGDSLGYDFLGYTLESSRDVSESFEDSLALLTYQLLTEQELLRKHEVKEIFSKKEE